MIQTVTDMYKAFLFRSNKKETGTIPPDQFTMVINDAQEEWCLNKNLLIDTNRKVVEDLQQLKTVRELPVVGSVDVDGFIEVEIQETTFTSYSQYKGYLKYVDQEGFTPYSVKFYSMDDGTDSNVGQINSSTGEIVYYSNWSGITTGSITQTDIFFVEIQYTELTDPVVSAVFLTGQLVGYHKGARIKTDGLTSNLWIWTDSAVAGASGFTISHSLLNGGTDYIYAHAGVADMAAAVADFNADTTVNPFLRAYLKTDATDVMYVIAKDPYLKTAFEIKTAVSGVFDVGGSGAAVTTYAWYLALTSVTATTSVTGVPSEFSYSDYSFKKPNNDPHPKVIRELNAMFKLTYANNPFFTNAVVSEWLRADILVSDERHEIMSNPLKTPSDEKMYYEERLGKIHLINSSSTSSDKNPNVGASVPTKLRLEYLRYPPNIRYVDGTYGSGKDIDCILDPIAQSEIVDIAVRRYSGVTTQKLNYEAAITENSIRQPGQQGAIPRPPQQQQQRQG